MSKESTHRKRRPLATRLIRRLIAAAVAVMVVSVLLSVGIEYLRGSRRLEAQLNAIKNTDVWPITESMWVSNYQMLATQLEALTKEPYISYAAVREGEKVIVSTGQRSSRFPVTRSYPLLYMYDQKARDIGRLSVIADRGVVLADALEIGLIAALFPIVTSIVLGVFMYVVFHRLVVSRILAISTYLRTSTPHTSLVA